MKKENKTIAGTDIEEVKRRNNNSGLTYNQAKELLANKRKMIKNQDDYI